MTNDRDSADPARGSPPQGRTPVSETVALRRYGFRQTATSLPFLFRFARAVEAQSRHDTIFTKVARETTDDD